MTLKRLGDSQVQIQDYIKRQEELFMIMADDVKAGKLQQGMKRSDIIAVYGEPVISRADRVDPAVEQLLYRHPTEYFTSDRIYLYFDQAHSLVRWEYVSFQEKE